MRVLQCLPNYKLKHHIKTMIKNLDSNNIILMDACIHYIYSHADGWFWYNVGSQHIGLTFPSVAAMDKFKETAIYEYLKQYEKETSYTKFLSFEW